jgi:hypothetical protein
VKRRRGIAVRNDVRVIERRIASIVRTHGG